MRAFMVISVGCVDLGHWRQGLRCGQRLFDAMSTRTPPPSPPRPCPIHALITSPETSPSSIRGRCFGCASTPPRSGAYCRPDSAPRIRSPRHRCRCQNRSRRVWCCRPRRCSQLGINENTRPALLDPAHPSRLAKGVDHPRDLLHQSQILVVNVTQSRSLDLDRHLLFAVGSQSCLVDLAEGCRGERDVVDIRERPLEARLPPWTGLVQQIPRLLAGLATSGAAPSMPVREE